MKSTSLGWETAKRSTSQKLGSLGCGLQELLRVADRHLSAVVEDGGVLRGWDGEGVGLLLLSVSG